MRLATVGVSNMKQALSLFQGIMQLKVERSGPVPRSLLNAWKVAPGVKALMAELSCKGYPIGRLRLVEFTPTPSQKVRVDFGAINSDSGTDVGPKAIDFYVADPIVPSVRKIEAAGYKFRSPPVKHQIADSISEECLFSGPDGVPVLIMVGHRHALTSMRAGSPDGPFSEIPTISIVAGDLTRTRAFYAGVLGLTAVTDAETPEQYRSLVNNLTGTPDGTRIHFLLYADKPEASGKILCVHFFNRTGKRLTGRMKPGNLGFSLLTHDAKNLDELHQALRVFGAEIVTPPMLITDDGMPYKVMLAKGPNEEMFEFTQFVAIPSKGRAAQPKAKKAAAKKKAAKKPAAKAKAKSKASKKPAKKKAAKKKP
ncbi:MAG: VOC family protein [Rhodospirillaceae bacterium]|nr:VOC family protein [Rhodospirillaceae bacterium]